MSENTRQEDKPSSDDATVNPVRAVLKRLRDWSAGHPWRSGAIGTGLLLMGIGTLAGWVFLSSWAVVKTGPSLDQALAAWDRRDLAEAERLVHRMQRSSEFGDALGGALFILGAVKTEAANSQWSEILRQTDYFVAARYLAEARSYGFPAGREGEGLFLLGKAQVKSRQLDDGIATLDDALDLSPPSLTELHTLLSQALLRASEPQLEKALAHNGIVLDNEQLSPDERADALLLRAQILNELENHQEAFRTLASLPVDTNRRAWVELLTGQVLLGQAAKLQRETIVDDADEQPDIQPIVDQALQHLQSAQSLERLAGEVTRRSLYFQGRAHQLFGDFSAAINFFTSVRQSYPNSAEGFAATLAEAEVAEVQDAENEALAAYRHVLESVGETTRYENPVLPLPKLRQRINEALNRYVSRRQFEAGAVLLDHFVPLFDEASKSERRARFLEEWGELLIRQAAGDGEEQLEQQKAGRRRRREAGVAYHRLAQLRYATEDYPDYMWKAAENYFAGRNYSRTVRVLNEYLQQEAEQRNPQALLRLGQSHLALGNYEPSIAAFEECIDFHPHDEAIYKARIECSKAYRYQGDLVAAEQLLHDNLTNSRMTPRSPEWRESLRELGSLLHKVNRHEEAISYLEEYIRRRQQHRERFQDREGLVMNDDSEALLANYLIAESHRLAAMEPLQQFRAARLPGERDKVQQAADQHLRAAEERYRNVLHQIRRSGETLRHDEMRQAMNRNCYMLLGSVLFDQGRYDDAREAYQNVSSLYQNEPFVLETFVQIAHCWRRLNQPEKARGVVQEAQFVLSHLPPDADFQATTSFSREQWNKLIDEMTQW